MGLTAKAEEVGNITKIANSMIIVAKNFVFMTLPPLRFIYPFYLKPLFHLPSIKKDLVMVHALLAD